MRRHFGDLVFETVVPRSVRLAEAPSHGLPAIALRPALARRRGLLEGGDGACRARLSQRPRRGLGRGLEVLIGGAGDARARAARRSTQIHPNPRQPRRASTTRRPPASPTRSARRASSSRSRAAAAEGGYELIAGERRWRAAREAGLRDRARRSCARPTTATRCCSALVENVAREQLSPVEEARAYAVLLDEFELSLGEVAERVGRSKPSRLEPAAPARAARRRARDGRARRALRGPRPRRARRAGPGRAAAGSRARSSRQGLSVRAAERAARWAGAKQKPRGEDARRSIRRWPRARATRVAAADRAPEARVRGGRSRSSSPTSTSSRSSPRRSRRCGLATGRSGHGRSWIRTADLRLIRAAL